MKYCYLFFLVFAVIISFSACEGLESDFEEMEEYAEEESEYCFEFVFPVTITLPDGTTFTGNSEEEIFSTIDQWYEDNGESDIEPSLVFPIQIILGDQRIDISSQEEFYEAEELCDHESDEEDEEDEEEDEFCFEFVFPISVIMPDGSTLTGNSEEEIYDALDQWYEENGESDIEPSLVFPVQVVFGDQRIDITSQDEFEEIEERCEDEDYEDEEFCFEFVFPISIIMPDGSTITGNSEEEIEEALEQWYLDNGENDVEPRLVFPIQIIVGDQRINISSQEELEEVEERCEHEDEEEFDCEEIRADFGDPCRLDNGTEGIVSENCVCI